MTCVAWPTVTSPAAALMLVFMFSLTGIPPTAGFIGKFYLLSSCLHRRVYHDGGAGRPFQRHFGLFLSAGGSLYVYELRYR